MTGPGLALINANASTDPGLNRSAKQRKEDPMAYGPDVPLEPMEDYLDSLEQKVDEALNPALEIQRAINEVKYGRPEDLYIGPDHEPPSGITHERELTQRELNTPYLDAGDPALFQDKPRLEDFNRELDLERALKEGKSRVSIKVGFGDNRHHRR